MFLSELSKSPYILKEDPASFDFDFNKIKPDIFNEDRAIVFYKDKFRYDNDSGKLSSVIGAYASIYSMTPVADSSGNLLMQFNADIGSTGNLVNPAIEVDTGSSTSVLPYVEGDGVSMILDSILNIDTDYTLRFRIVADNYISVWSDYITIHTTPAVIVSPSITANQDLGDLIDPKSLSTSLSSFKVYGYDDEWQSTDWQVLDADGNAVDSGSITDSAVANIVDLSSVAMDYGNDYQLQVKYVGTDGHESAWSTVSFKTATYVIDNLGISSLNNAQDFGKDVTVNGGQTPDDGNLVVSVGLGSVDYDGYNFTWSIPDYDEDKVSSLSVWIEDTDGNRISTVYSQTVSILNIDIVADDAAVITGLTDISASDNFIYTYATDRVFPSAIIFDQGTDETNWKSSVTKSYENITAADVINVTDNTYTVYSEKTFSGVTGFDSDNNIIVENLQKKISTTVDKNSTNLSAVNGQSAIIQLNNQNILIIYKDTNNNNYGTYTIIDSNYNVVVDPTVFESAGVTQISATLLNDDNVFILYAVCDDYSDGAAKMVIIDKDGNVIVDPAQVAANVVSVSLNMDLNKYNGNIIIVYSDHNNNNYGTFVIYDQDGNVVKDPAVFDDDDDNSVIYVKSKTNGEFVILNGYYGNTSKYAYLFDADGNLLYDKSYTDARVPGDYSKWNVMMLNNNSFLITYDPNYITVPLLVPYLIYDFTSDDGLTLTYSGNLPLRSDALYAYTIQMKQLRSGNIILFSTSSLSKSYGIIIDDTGNVLYDNIVLDSAIASYWGCDSNTNVIIDEYGNINIVSNDLTSIYKLNFAKTITLQNDYNELYLVSQKPYPLSYQGTDKLQNIDIYDTNKLKAYIAADDPDSITNIYINNSFNSLSIDSVSVSDFDTGDKTIIDRFNIANNTAVNYLDSTVLSNGNVVIAYIDSSNTLPYFVIYSPDGQKISGPVRVYSYATCYNVRVQATTNDTFIVSFTRDDVYYSVYDNDGNGIDTNNDIGDGGSSYRMGLSANGDYVVFAYADNGNDNKCRCLVYDYDGNMISDTIINNYSTKQTDCVIFNNDNILVIYNDDADNDYGKYVLIDKDGNVIVSETKFSSNGIYSLSCTGIPNSDNCVIAYSDGGVNGYYMIIDQDGNVVKDSTSFVSNIYVNNVSCKASSNRFCISYKNKNTDNENDVDPQKFYYSVYDTGSYDTYIDNELLSDTLNTRALNILTDDSNMLAVIDGYTDRVNYFDLWMMQVNFSGHVLDITFTDDLPEIDSIDICNTNKEVSLENVTIDDGLLSYEYSDESDTRILRVKNVDSCMYSGGIQVELWKSPE